MKFKAKHVPIIKGNNPEKNVSTTCQNDLSELISLNESVTTANKGVKLLYEATNISYGVPFKTNELGKKTKPMNLGEKQKNNNNVYYYSIPLLTVYLVLLAVV